jgi:hypothetical protein
MERQPGTVPDRATAADHSKEALQGLPAADRTIIATLEAADRLELSNWYYDAPRVPDAPGVLMYFETPFRMMWVEPVDNLNQTLKRHSEGLSSDLTRVLFHAKVIDHLTPQQAEQLLTKALTIESIMSIKTKQIVSYRFAVVNDPDSRKRIADAIVRGASQYGVPEFAEAIGREPGE